MPQKMPPEESPEGVPPYPDHCPRNTHKNVKGPSLSTGDCLPPGGVPLPGAPEGCLWTAWEDLQQAEAAGCLQDAQEGA